MKKLFAIPTIGGRLCTHFGRCEEFSIVETEDGKVTNEIFVQPPAHEPGAYPAFLATKGVSAIISGGMGIKAQQLFAQNNIEVLMGVNSDQPASLVNNYLASNLITGENLCDGDDHHHDEHSCKN